MRVRTFIGTLVVLSIVAVAWRTIPAQEPKAEAQPKAIATGPKAGEGAVAQAVDRLVEQLRRYPARPSTAADQLGLFLIAAEGGEPTLIANEPDTWLARCGRPAWSHDGRRILFEAATAPGPPSGSGALPMTRLKALELNEGRPAIVDLGPGSCGDFSPADDRIIFRLNPGSAPGVQPGVWIMRADGSDRRLMGGDGRPRWSPDNQQFLIVSPSDPRDVTIVDVRPERSGALRIADRNIFSEPSWAGEATTVAAIGSDAADTIALVDVSTPDAAKVKEVLWKQGTGLQVRPSWPVYSPAGRRCIFVGEEEGKGQALFSFQAGQAEPPRRLEKEGFDKTIQELALSPDGRYVVFASDRRSASPRRPSVDAPALSGITIDGDLKDWPAAMPRYPIQNIVSLPQFTGPGRREQAFLTTGPDLSAAFSVGYDPKEQLIYLAVVVRDDHLIVGHTSVWDTDATEIYVDGLHSQAVREAPPELNWMETMDAGEAPVLQYIGIPADKGPVYAVKKSAGQVRTGEDNPILMFGDIKKTKTRMAFRRVGDVTTYEWALQAFDHYPDKPTKLRPGVQIGFDIVVIDKDKPAQTPEARDDPEPDWQAWVCWGPPWRRSKFFDAANLGELVLGRAPGP
jgi:Tol biopolymer transport system component